MFRLPIILGLVLSAGTALAAEEKTYRDADGLIRVRPPKVDKQFQNAPWPEELEKGFWKRGNEIIRHFAGSGEARVGAGEAEKWSYPKQMLNFLSGNKGQALGILQAIDNEDGRHTAGVDFYWCFTLKGQMRKSFWLGDHLAPEYMERMKKGAKIWTADDPRPMFELILALESKDQVVRKYALDQLNKMKAELDKEKGTKTDDFGDDISKFEEVERIMNIRPHPDHGKGTGPVGTTWDAKVRGGVVDARCTDNLRAMRETAVYLMAEETGNETVRRLYKEKIKRYVRALYTIGMGEWDSENYHGHTFNAYINLYDFAKDPEVKMLGKAALDWLSTAAALKYYRGGYGGPTKRDYGGASKPFGSGVAHLMYLYFGDTPKPDPDAYEDDVHALTSSYRPPLAVVNLATHNFSKPVELWNTKPTYSNWTPGADESPEFWETIYYGNTFYLGTCTSASGSGDVGAFKLLAYNAKDGVDYFLANSGKKLNSKNGRDQIAQYANLAIFLRAADNQPFMFQVPKGATVESSNGTWYIGMQKTYLALKLINLENPAETKNTDKGNKASDQKFFAAKQTGGPVAGFALVVGEEGQYKNFADFKQQIAAGAKLDLAALADGKASLSAGGKTLAMQYNKANDLPVVIRDGKQRNWAEEKDLYRTVLGEHLVSLGWKDGTLKITAGGKTFTQTVTEDGKVSFEEK